MCASSIFGTNYFRYNFETFSYVTQVRASNTISIGYKDTHFVKRKSTKMVYPSIRSEYQIRHSPWTFRIDVSIGT
jgi:hypothetical protein